MKAYFQGLEKYLYVCHEGPQEGGVHDICHISVLWSGLHLASLVSFHPHTCMQVLFNLPPSYRLVPTFLSKNMIA